MVSTTRTKRERYRCSDKSCLTRFKVLRKRVRPPRCPVCGSTKVYSIEDSRRRQADRQDTCECTRYPFPHKRGSLRMCEYHPLIGVEPTEDEIADYEACLATPRSSFC